ncbi:MAG TPA: LamG-like jellyroll fold domain-containing protein [Nitrososphaeraceae archaeon]|nr:LamG-like jellyroll fold domain-containing protein [Nitrososphaeraceae archaeon]
MSTPITAENFQISRSYFNYLDFDGVNDSVDCGNDATMWSATLSKFGFCFWIFPTASGDGNDRTVVTHGSASNQGWGVFIDTAVAGRIRFDIKNNVGTIFSAFSNNLVVDAWNYIVCTYDNSLGSANVKIYVNNVLGSQTANLTQTLTLSASLLWGNTTTDFKGRMIDFRFWGNDKLDATMMDYIFNNNDLQYVFSNAPYAWWRIDEGSGNPIDVMANKTATLSGTIWGFQTGLGGDISPRILDIIDVNDENNLWTNATGAECQNGMTSYRVFYVRYLGDPGVNGNTNAKTLKNLSLALAQATKKTGYTTFQWAFVPNARRSWYRDRDSKVFNGTTDFSSKNDEAALDLTTFSICAWVRTTKDYSVGGLDGAIVRKGDVGATLNYGIWVEDAGNIFRGGFEQTGTGTDVFVDSPRAYNDGMWHMVVLTYNGSSVMRLYVDNIKVASLGTALVPGTNASPLTIGRASAASTHFFQGEIDSVRIWNTALTEGEIYELYHQNKEPQSANLVYERHYGRNNNLVDMVSPILKNGGLGPFAAVTQWFDERSDIPNLDDIQNIGEFKFGQYFPVLGKWTNEAGTPDIQNDFVQFNLHYSLMVGSTGGGSSGGGTDPDGTPDGGPDPTTPPNNQDYYLGFNSDWDSTSTTQKNFDLIHDFREDFNPPVDRLLCGGDLAYGDPSDFFDICKKNLLFEELKISIGNHDDGDRGEFMNASYNQGNKYYQNKKKSYYYYVEENVAIIAMDTEIDFDSGSPQHVAVTQFFKEIKAMKNVDWKIVLFHKPMFGASSDHGYNEGNFNQTYFQMFDDNGVDFVLCGHNHNYQRSFPVKYNSGSPASPKVTDSGAGPYDANDGLIHILNGTGGHDSGGALYSLGSQPSFIKFQNNKDNGMVFFTFTNNNKTVTVKWQTTEGKVRDTFVVNK